MTSGSQHRVGAYNLITSMSCFEAMLSSRPHPASIAGFPEWGRCQHKGPSRPGTKSCPLISRKEQSLQPHPPTLSPACSVAVHFPAVWGRKRRRGNQVQPDGQAVLLISCCGDLGPWSGGVAAKQARVAPGYSTGPGSACKY